MKHSGNSNILSWIVLITMAAGLSVGFTSSTVPVYRIGLMLPLSGRYRDTGVDVFFATRMALLNGIRSGTMPDYRVEFVTYDDRGNPTLAAQYATALAGDPLVVAVVGHWRPTTTQAALPAYQAAGLPLITTDAADEAATSTTTFTFNVLPETWQTALDNYLFEAGITDAAVFPPITDQEVTEAAHLALNSSAGTAIGGYDWGLEQFQPLVEAADPAHDGELWFLTHAGWPGELADAEEFRVAILNSDIPNAVEPGPISALAHDAVVVALAAIHQAHADGTVSRAAVLEAISNLNVTGWTGDITFDDDGYRADAPLYLYCWDDTGAPVLIERLR